MVKELRRLVAILSRPTQRRLVAAFLGSLVVAFAEVVGLLTVLPLVQLLTGTDPGSSPATAALANTAGTDDIDVLIQFAATVMLLAFLIKGGASVIIRWWSLGFVFREESATSRALLTYYIRAPFSMHVARGSADFIRTMNDSVSVVFNLVVVGVVSVMTEATTIALITGMLFLIMPLPTLGFALYFGTISVLFIRYSRSRTVKYGRVMTDASLDTYKSAMHILGAIKEVKIRNDPSYLVSQYADAKNSFAWARQRASFFSELPKYLLEMFFITGLALATIGLIAFNGAADSLALIAFLVVSGFRILPSVARLLGAVGAIRVGAPSLSLVLRDVEASSALAVPPVELHDPMTLDRAIDLVDVTFRYPGMSQDVLRSVNLSIPAGSSIAFVGMSGAGKTTLVDILMGLHLPTSGSVRVDGVDIGDDLSAWQRSIGLVPQDVYLLDDSLTTNIAFGVAPDAIDLHRVSDAASRAQLDSLLSELSAGMDQVVGERGARLSGGQRQRIGIARALYQAPQLLVLDEATSALDSDTESKITETIRALRGELTVVVVAHRLSTVRDCDQVVFLEGGRVAAVGSFDEVRHANSEFARLVRLGTLESAGAP